MSKKKPKPKTEPKTKPKKGDMRLGEDNMMELFWKMDARVGEVWVAAKDWNQATAIDNDSEPIIISHLKL